MFLFYLLLFVFVRLGETTNTVAPGTAKIEDLFPLPTNDHFETITAQFQQNLDWEYGNEPTGLTEAEETTPTEPKRDQLKTGPGIIKLGHLYQPDHDYPYRIDRHDVHPASQHYVFLIRHGNRHAFIPVGRQFSLASGLYLNTEDDASSHLLRYGKYQARMAGYKINQIIQEIVNRAGRLTRPIKLVSSTQTRAFETLYNIRLQLSNELEYESEIIQDTGLTECLYDATPV